MYFKPVAIKCTATHVPLLCSGDNSQAIHDLVFLFSNSLGFFDICMYPERGACHSLQTHMG